MQLTDFFNLKLGSFVYHTRDLDIRRTATQFVENRTQQYLETNPVMWTRPAFGNGYGRDIEMCEAWQWEPLPINVWETNNQELINRFIVLQQRYIIEKISILEFTNGRI